MIRWWVNILFVDLSDFAIAQEGGSLSEGDTGHFILEAELNIFSCL